MEPDGKKKNPKKKKKNNDDELNDDLYADDIIKVLEEEFEIKIPESEK